MISATTTAQSHSHPTDGPIDCLNCGQQYTGRYCNQCGQRADTHKINWHYIWHEIPHSIWHVDQGILFTLRELVTRPGYTIRDFLNGKRVKHYRPLALLFILGAIVVFASHSLNVSFAERSQELFSTSETVASNRVKAFQQDVKHFVEKNQNIVHIVMIPLYALWFWVLFRRRGYNYPEMLVTQTFVANFNLLVSLVTVLLFWALGGSVSAFTFVTSLTLIVMIAYNAWVYMTLFSGKLRPQAIIARAVIAYIASYVSLILIIGVIVVGYVFFVMRHDPKPESHSLKTSSTVQQLH